jgi:hypothetical protein
MEAIKIEDITPDTLDRIAEQWEQHRIELLVRSSMVKLGDQLRHARAEAVNAETRAKIRALKLFHQYNLPPKEIAEMLGLHTNEVRAWLK